MPNRHRWTEPLPPDVESIPEPERGTEQPPRWHVASAYALAVVVLIAVVVLASV